MRVPGWGGATSGTAPLSDPPAPGEPAELVPLALPEQSPGPRTYSDIVAVQGTTGAADVVILKVNGQAQYGSRGQGGSLSCDRNNALDTSQSMEDVASSFGTNRVSTYLWDTITRRRVD